MYVDNYSGLKLNLWRFHQSQLSTLSVTRGILLVGCRRRHKYWPCNFLTRLDGGFLQILTLMMFDDFYFSNSSLIKGIRGGSICACISDLSHVPLVFMVNVLFLLVLLILLIQKCLRHTYWLCKVSYALSRQVSNLKTEVYISKMWVKLDVYIILI